jgi:hypothetical protein
MASIRSLISAKVGVSGMMLFLQSRQLEKTISEKRLWGIEVFGRVGRLIGLAIAEGFVGVGVKGLSGLVSGRSVSGQGW